LIAPHVALALVRLCFDAAAIAAYGVSGFIAWIAPNRLGQAIAASSNFLIVAASSLAVLSTLAWLPIEAAMIGDSTGNRPTIAALCRPFCAIPRLAKLGWFGWLYRCF
jgi:hypothetical protein